MTIHVAIAPSISPDDLVHRIDDPSLVIVDVRPIAAFNGWRLSGETRGGHIPRAFAFPSAWLDLVEDDELGQVLEAKGINPDKSVVLYGDPGEVKAVANALSGLDYRNVRTLEGGFNAWLADETRPIERLAKYERLVHPDWLHELISGGRPDTLDNDAFLLFHVNFGVPEEYDDGHLPGAFYLDTNWLESPDDWNRRSPEELERALTTLGITFDTTVVLYGRDTVGDPNEKWPGRRAGQIAATRAASILRYAGVDDVRLLDGGYDWWVNAGHPLETQAHTPSLVPSFGVPIPQRPELIVDIDDAKAILADRDGATLVSVRTWKEHIGRVSGYNYIEPKGRIAGDVWGNCGTDAYHMQHYRNVDNTMRAYPEIAANWAKAGITPDKWVAFYCGTGWRASETWFYAYLMGWERIAVYDGGWFEWSGDPDNNPIETGDPSEELVA
ncbi:MAG: rhodanese-like domain-containing protein [Acidimicrobiia bacterium]